MKQFNDQGAAPVPSLASLNRPGHPSLILLARRMMILLCVCYGLALLGLSMWQSPTEKPSEKRPLPPRIGPDAASTFARKVLGPQLLQVPPDSDDLITLLKNLKVPEGLGVVVFDERFRCIFSNQDYFDTGLLYGNWDSGGKTPLSQRMASLSPDSCVVSTLAPQSIGGWQPQQGSYVFYLAPRGGYSAMLLPENPASAPTTTIQREVPGWAIALCLSGLGILASCLYTNRLTRRYHDSINSFGRAIQQALETGVSLRRASLATAELVALAEFLETRKTLNRAWRATRSAESAENTARKVLNSIYDAVLLLGRDGKILWANRRMEEKFLISQLAAKGLHASKFAADRQCAAVMEAGLSAAWRGESALFSTKCKRLADAHYFPVEVFVIRILLGGSDVLCASFRDITEARNNELALRQAVDVMNAAKATADEANRAKGDFLARMSHEIRTPMNAIIGLSYIALRDSTEPRSVANLEKIHRSTLSLLSILNDIFDFTKLESGKVEIRPEAFSPAKLFSAVSDIASLRCMGKPVEFVLDVPSDLPLALRADPLRLQQLLSKFVDNAIKFTASGKVTLRVHYYEVHGILRCEVEDQGIGISKEQLQRLFVPFEKADGASTHRYGGSGLGLVICQRLVHLMGGKIDAHSTLGVGSIFRFEIPAPIAQRTELSRLSPRLDNETLRLLKGKRVLVVDDNEINREIATELIKENGCFVDSVMGGSEALSKLQNEQFDMVFLDIEMPDMNGLEAARRIRALDAPVRSIPIIAMSAHAFAESKIQAFEAGMDGYVVKPIVMNHLRTELMRLVPSPLEVPAAAEGPASDANALPCQVTPVLEAESAIEAMGGSRSLYDTVARSFMTQWEDAEEQLSRAAARDAVEAMRIAHTLKGLAFSLGLMRLGAAAAVFASRYRNHKAGPASFDAGDFPEILAVSLEALSAYLNPHSLSSHASQDEVGGDRK